MKENSRSSACDQDPAHPANRIDEKKKKEKRKHILAIIDIVSTAINTAYTRQSIVNPFLPIYRALENIGE